MRTDDLIVSLADSPWPKERPAVRVVAALAGGWAIALAGLILVLGLPFAAVSQTGVPPFAVKTGFTITLTALLVFAAIAAGRPGKRLARRAALIPVPFLLLGLMAVLELGAAPRDDWSRLLFGSTFGTCVTAIVLASVPVLAGTFWAYRLLAPTNLPLAGFLTGFSSGAAAAAAYALYCPETTASFLLASYTPGILVPAALGTLLGPKLLHW